MSKNKDIISLVIFSIFFTLLSNAQENNPLTKQEKGYFNITELGYYAGLNDRTIQTGPNEFSRTYATVNTISLRNINGLFITNHLSLGVGLGLDGFQIKNGAFYNTFQLFGDVRYYFKNQDNTWYAYGNLGKAVKIDPAFQEGLSGGGGIGIKFMPSWKTAILVSAGYQEQEIKTTPRDRQRIPSFAFKAGLLF